MEEKMKAAIAGQKEEIQRYTFERIAEDFIDRWAPEDRSEAAQFSSQLFGIFRQLCMDIQKPVHDQMMSMVSAWPHPLIVRKEDLK